MNKSDFLNFACKIIEKEGGLLWYTKPKDGVYSTQVQHRTAIPSAGVA